MKYSRTLFIILLGSLISIANAQDQRTLRTKVVDILNLVPADNPSQLEDILGRTVAIGSDGYNLLLSRLTPEGDATDLRQRYLIEGLSRYLSKDDNRTDYNQALINKITDPSVDASVRIFLLDRMLLTAQEENLDAFIELLDEPDLFEAAIRNIVNLGSEKSIEPLFDGLEAYGDGGSLEILKALADLNMDTHIPEIVGFLESNPDPAYLQSGLKLLANSGSKEAFEFLKSAVATYPNLQPRGQLMLLGEVLGSIG